MVNLSDLSLDEVKERLYDRPENIIHLKEFFGNKNVPPVLESG